MVNVSDYAGLMDAMGMERDDGDSPPFPTRTAESKADMICLVSR